MTSKETTIQDTKSAGTNLLARSKSTATIVTMVAVCGVLGCNRTESDTQRDPGPEERTPAAVEPDNTGWCGIFVDDRALDTDQQGAEIRAAPIDADKRVALSAA